MSRRGHASALQSLLEAHEAYATALHEHAAVETDGDAAEVLVGRGEAWRRVLALREEEGRALVAYERTLG